MPAASRPVVYCFVVLYCAVLVAPPNGTDTIITTTTAATKRHVNRQTRGKKREEREANLDTHLTDWAWRGKCQSRAIERALM